jgi:hypothetical protein
MSTTILNCEPAAITSDGWQGILSRYSDGTSGPSVRRKHPRFGVGHGLVNLSFEYYGQPVTDSGTLLDVSMGGMMVKGTKAVAPETKVRIVLTLDSRPILLFGRVAHSTQTVGGYKIGIELSLDVGK